MKIFITASFEGENNKSEVEKLCSIIKSAGFEDFCFVRDIESYKKVFTDPKKLMLRAKSEISKCDALLIDLTDKPTGRAYEAGIAYALGKKIIVIAKRGTNLKDTTRGIANIVIEYEQLEDISSSLVGLAKLWL